MIDPDAAAVPSSCGTCAEYAAPVESGRVEPTELSALSGLSWSRTQPEVLYAHNDHDRPVVYALDLEGRLHARIDLADAPAEDIEDTAVGPCGGTDSCVFLGDIGDNPAARAEYAILRFVEPSIPSEPGSTAIAPPFERFAFTYEDGSHNAEGLMVAPDGDVYIVTKLAAGSGGPVAADGVSSVYRLAAPLSSDSVATAEKVATLPIPAASDLAASAAAAHPCEPAFLVRTYDRVYELRAPAGEPFEAALTADPVVVAMPDEPQSEGIDYRPDGRGFASSGEGARAPIMLTDCR